MAVYSSKKDYSKSSKPQKTLKERMADIKARRAKSKAARAKKKAGKSWTKAVKKQKKKGEEGVTLSSLIAKRKDLTKGTAEYAAVQNKINKAYGSKVRHKATVASPKKEVSKGKGKSFRKAFADAEGKDFIWDGRKYSGKKAAPKKAAVKKAPAKAKTFGKEGLKKKAQEASKSRISTPDSKKIIAEVEKQTTEEWHAPKVSPEEKAPVTKKKAKKPAGEYVGRKAAQGGLVESNPFGWPSKDARNGGKK